MSSDNYSIPLNAYPLASTEGRAIPLEAIRPGWAMGLGPGSVVEMPDEVNLVTLHAPVPLLLQELGNLKPSPIPELKALSETPQMRTVYLPAGQHQLILCRWIQVSAECTINGHVLWQQMRPTTQWRK